ncbi:MAG: glycosyltransferase family 4 protein [candidate division Zixibacteria bacterium]|nr:glycosyltransferase family 4 protein [candidate division Zixibacteria bacterium]
MADPIRVLLLTHNYPRYPGDPSGVFLSLLAGSLLPHGIKPHVLAPHDAGIADRERDGDIVVHRFRYADDAHETLAYRGNMHQMVLGSPGGAWRFRQFLSSFEKAAETIIAEERIDLVWAHWLVPAGIVLKRLSKHYRIPLLLSSHGTDIRLLSKYRLIAWPYFKPLVPRLAAWTVVSSFLKDQLTAIDSGLASALSVLSLPHDERLFFSDKSVQRDPHLIVAVTRFTDQKRVDKLVSAFKIVHEAYPAARLDLYGAGPLQAQVSDQIRNDDLTGAVRINAPVAQSDLARIYNIAAVVVLNSVNEGFGLALSEAMLCGAAVVGVRSGGIIDIITDGETGLLAPPDNPAELADCILRLLRDQSLRQRLASAGQASAMGRYASGPLAARYAELVRKAVASRRT